MADDVVRRLGSLHFETDQWYFQSVSDPELGVVEAIIAIAKPEATIGDNLNTVLLIRVGDEFEAWSWRNTTQARAVYSAKVILNVSDDDDMLWLLDEELPWWDENALRPPTPYIAGMLTDDPLFEAVMGSDNPPALISMLADLGYPVAELRPPSGDEGPVHTCSDEAQLRWMVDIGEWGLANSSLDQEASAITLPSIISGFSRCPLPGTCIPNETPWVVQEFSGPCDWKLIDSKVVDTDQHGSWFECSYEKRKQVKQMRTRTITTMSCVNYSEFQCRSKDIVVSTATCTRYRVLVNPPGPACFNSPDCPHSEGNCGNTGSWAGISWGSCP